MKHKLKKIRSIAALLPFVIILCAIEMGGCDSGSGSGSGSEVICEQAKQQLKDADNALDKAKQDVREAEKALTQ